MVKIGVSHNFTLMPHIIDQMPTVSINLEQDNLRLSDVESSSVYNNLMQVTELNVSGLSEEECTGICKSLILLTNLTKLVMTEYSLTDVQTFVTSLKHLHALTDLDLSKNQLDSATLDHIIRFLPSTLISLSLSHNMANGEFSLKHLTKLVRLNLSHNNLKLPLYSLLLNIPERLKYLDISFNKIQNVDQVGKMISDFSQLCYINMNSNQIGAVGVQTLISDMESYDAKCDIDVSHNVFGLQKIIPYIANQLPTSAILPDFERENLTLKDEHLQVFFKNIPKITTVEIPKKVEWSETDYKSVLNDLSFFSNLESLTFASLNPAIFPFLAESLKNFTYLRHLDISGSRIDNQGVKVVGNALLSLKRLEYINFSNTNIGMPDIKFLLDIHWQHISKPFINVASNVHFVQAIFPSIKDQLSGSSIKGIDFDSDELNVISFTNIVQMTQLTNVSARWKHFTDKDFEDFIQWLKYLNPELLDLSHNNIGDSGAKSLSEVMMSMHGLTHLNLSHNNIGDNGAKSLSEGMRSMRVLTHLDLSHNNIGDSGAESLSEVMRSMDGLTHLDLSHNNIGDNGLCRLSEGMMHVLTHLDLSHNKIGDSAAKSLSEMMWSMAKITNLDPSHNKMGDSSAMDLSKGMRSMDGLAHLNLSHNNIGFSGATRWGLMMMSMHRLTHLDLSHNNIGDSGAKSLSEGMRFMRRLTHLDLSHNNTQYSGTKSDGEGISSVTGFEESEAASEKEKATYKSAKSSMSYSQEEQHSKEMSYHRTEHTEQTLLPSSPQPSTSGYVPPTEKDPAKS
ncbi:NLR family CARD domain-containing protein 3-like [Ptychodera flava]|uniref:NLR family CARD domain-containing protein 3-like n=1 Tax=Ptychodera flava TaxID=63121 RepID=UPI003969D44D